MRLVLCECLNSHDSSQQQHIHTQQQFDVTHTHNINSHLNIMEKGRSYASVTYVASVATPQLLSFIDIRT